MKDNRVIVVNATALRIGGALTILRQFLLNIEGSNCHYILFVDQFADITCSKSNVEVIRLNKTGMASRIMWDWFGLNKWLQEHAVVPDLFISLQNTSVRLSYNCPKLIYLHQPLPFSDKQWSPFKKEEYKFFLYKKFYSYFIFRFVDVETLFVVQTDWIKKGLIEKFGIANDKISVFKPDLSEFDKDDIKPLNLSSGKKIIFYPATPIIYKNHIEILNALSYLRCAGNDLSDILVCFTFHEADSPRLSDVVKSEGLTDLVKFMGPISYSKVLAYYKESTVVAFPSYIETFGLPLIEAAEFGKVILVADEPYSKDVLAGYNKAVFLPINDSKAWAGALKKVIKNSEKENKNPKYSGLSETLGNRPGWRAFFSFIEGLR